MTARFSRHWLKSTRAWSDGSVVGALRGRPFPFCLDLSYRHVLAMATVTLGLGGAARHACAALCAGQKLVAACEQER
jgi:hypothetical protein